MTGIEVITTSLTAPSREQDALLIALLMLTFLAAVFGAMFTTIAKHKIRVALISAIIFTAALAGAITMHGDRSDYIDARNQARDDTLAELQDHYGLDLPTARLTTHHDAVEGVAALDRLTKTPVSVIVVTENGRMTVYGDADGKPATEYRTNTAK